jgi:HEAT repeat protein
MSFVCVTKRRFLLIVVVAVLALSIFTLRALQPTRARDTAPRELAVEASGLASADPAERAEAVRALRNSGSPAAADLLVARLDDPDPRVGLYVAQALGEIATPQVRPELRRALLHEDADVRWRAALALGERRDLVSVPQLSEALHDLDPEVVATAAGALGQIGSPDAVQALVAALDSDRPTTVHTASRALEALGEASVSELNLAVYSGSARQRLNAVTLLGYIASPQAAPALQLALLDADPAVREEARWALDELSAH